MGTKADCKLCLYFSQHGDEEQAGNCLRRAPAPSQYGQLMLLQLVAELHRKYLENEDAEDQRFTHSDGMEFEGGMSDWAVWPVVHWGEFCGEFELKCRPVDLNAHSAAAYSNYNKAAI